MTVSDKPYGRAAATLVGIITGLAFLPSLAGGFVWDDHWLIAGNARIRTPKSLFELVTTPFWSTSADLGEMTWAYRRLHRPFVKLAYHFEFRVFDGEPWGFHLVNVVLHVACALLVFDAVRARIPDRNGSSTLAATAAATLFAVHPTRVEPVAWISGATDLWMTFFVLLSEKALRDARGPARYGLGAVSLAMAGFSKEPALLVPFLIALDAFVRGEPRTTVAKRLGAGLAASSVVGVAALLVARAVADAQPPPSPNSGSWMPRVLASIGGNLELLVHAGPGSVFPMMLERDRHGAPMFSTTAIALGTLATGALLLLCVASIRRTVLRPWLADVAWFAVPLLPVLNLVPRNEDTLVTDRGLYLPLVGVAFASARALEPLFRTPGMRRSLTSAAVACLVVLCARFVVADSARFHDEIALWSNEVRVHPDSPMPYASLAGALGAAGRQAESFRVIGVGVDKAIASGDPAWQAQLLLRWADMMASTVPDSDQATLLMLRDLYDGFATRGTIAGVRDGRRFELRLGGRLRRLLQDDPKAVTFPRALVHVRTFDLEGGVRLLRGILAAHPRDAMAYHMLTVALARQGAFDEAIAASDAAQRALPSSSGFREIRATVEAARRIASRPAATSREAAIRDAEVQLALGAPEHARRILAPFLARFPVDHELVFLRSKVDVGDARFDLAEQTLEQARQAAPDDPFFPMLQSRLADERRRRGSPQTATRP